MIKGKVSHINQSQPQGLPNNQMKQCRHLFNQSKASGAFPEVSEQDWKIQILTNLTVALWSKGVNYELPPRPPVLKRRVNIWIECLEPEYEASGVEGGRVQIRGLISSNHYLREK